MEKQYFDEIKEKDNKLWVIDGKKHTSFELSSIDYDSSTGSVRVFPMKGTPWFSRQVFEERQAKEFKDKLTGVALMISKRKWDNC